MDRSQISKRMDEIRKEIGRLAVPKDPNQKKREKLLDELHRLNEAELHHFEKAVKETRKLLAKEIKELEGMCNKKFSASVPVKAKVKVKLEVNPSGLDTFGSSCWVEIDFPKDRKSLFLFTMDEEDLSNAGIVNTKQARGLLPDLDKHLQKLESLQCKVMKRIKEEAKKHGLQKQLDEFVDEVFGS